MPKAKSQNPEPESESNQQGERLQRVLANRGIASRRTAEQMITAGRISVNGTVVTVLGTRVNPHSDAIVVDGKPIKRQRPRFLMLNKPSGFITTVKDERSRWTVMDLIDVPERVYPVGRLDRETQGLILLTNDGDVANRVMHPSYGLTKEYQVITNKRPSERQFEVLRDGIEINGRTVVPDEVRLMRETREGIVIRIIIHEGLYHVVRRMMEIVNIEVLRLRRVRLGPLMLQGIPSGAWRDLTPGELVQIFEAVGMDRNAADKVNGLRPMQLEPRGGYRHAGTDSRSGPTTAEVAPRSTPPPTARPDAGPRSDRPNAKPPGGPRQARQQQRQAVQQPGGRADGPRPSSGNRDRRTRSGR
ncbi:MAG: pseudouridine synthase [Thermomicrobiales bacterium]